jgi:hypothetical protein
MSLGGVSIRAHCFGLALTASIALSSCSPNLRGTTAEHQLLVFPGEAELGATASAVISSNYVPGADELEEYQLERSRVEVWIEDASDIRWEATVRAVFPLAASATSKLAQTKPGAWATVVLFDLPTAAQAPTFDDSSPADVIVSLDGVEQEEDGRIGTIRITGTGGVGIGGQPTAILWPPIADLELDSLVMRYRPVLDADTGTPGGGFPPEAGGTQVAGIEADLVYFSPCFMDAEVYAGTEASNAGIHLGPQQVVGGAGFVVYRHLLVTYPDGFTLEPPVNLPPVMGSADRLGEGPLLEVAFDRPNQSLFDCDAFEEPLVWLWNVFVVRPDGSTVADQRGTGSFDESSDLFALYSIPAAR